MSLTSFFDKNYQTPSWLTEKLSRRHLLKSAAGATAVISMGNVSFAASEQNFQTAVTAEPWLTLNSVLMHLMPESASGPSADDIRAAHYLYNLVYQQPTPKDEIDFIFKGVGWLNGYSQGKTQQNFPQLQTSEKETMLRAISGSTAGENWISMLIGNLFEAMLSPPSYGGNPNGIGWKWLQHQAGFPLPKQDQRYYELPKRSTVKLSSVQSSTTQKITLSQSSTTAKVIQKKSNLSTPEQGKRKA